MLQLPRAAWSDSEAGPVVAAIVAYAEEVPAHQRTAQEFLEIVQLGTELAGRLPAVEAARTRRVLRDLGVSVFVVSTVREQMRYDVAELVVEAGRPFEIIFQNTDIMPHNLVVVAPGARAEIGLAAMAMPMTPDRAGRLYVPASEKVLGATRMLEPGQKETLKLYAPREPGIYEYVCTFPGHWTIMWGRLIVVDASGQAPDAPAAAAPVPAAGQEHQHGK